jgi:FKBP-type peptidyl-prolyl cis-trans isomerase FkpA
MEKSMQQWKRFALVALTALAAAAHAGTPEKTPSGLIYESLKDGSGPQPTSPKSVVQVHYRGALVDGKEFDNTYKREHPVAFPLSQVIPCWTHGIMKMKEGGKAKLTCPPETAYGAVGKGSLIPPNSTLIFEIELLKVVP